MGDFLSAKEKSARDLRDKAFNAGLNDKDTAMAIDYFINRCSHKEMAEKYHITAETSRNKKVQLNKKIRG